MSSRWIYDSNSFCKSAPIFPKCNRILLSKLITSSDIVTHILSFAYWYPDVGTKWRRCHDSTSTITILSVSICIDKSHSDYNPDIVEIITNRNFVGNISSFTLKRDYDQIITKRKSLCIDEEEKSSGDLSLLNE